MGTWGGPAQPPVAAALALGGRLVLGEEGGQAGGFHLPLETLSVYTHSRTAAQD